MADTFVIGGQPDYLSQVADTWTSHGREISSGDAEKTLDLAPSVRMRAPSPGSGELYFKKDWQEHMAVPIGNTPIPFERGVLGIVHNLTDVDAKVRVVIERDTGNPDFIDRLFGTETNGFANTTDDFSDVDQNPYGTITTRATPTDQSLPWSLDVDAFGNTFALQTNVEDSQILLVRLRFKGTYVAGDNTQGITITVNDTATLKATKSLEPRLADGESIVVSVPFDPDDFSPTTCANLSITVSMDGAASAGSGNLYWEIEAISWERIRYSITGTQGIMFDSGWVPVEQAARDLYYMGADSTSSSVIPYLNGSESVANLATRYTHVFFTWDEGVQGNPTYGKPRVYTGTDSNKLSFTDWRPEVGLIAEGPAWGTSTLKFGYKAGWTDPSVVIVSEGGNRWVRRLEPTRTLQVTFDEVDAETYATELFSVLRRAGVSRPFLVAIKPGADQNQAVKEAVSIYGYVSSFDGPSERLDTSGEKFSVSITFTEAV